MSRFVAESLSMVKEEAFALGRAVLKPAASEGRIAKFLGACPAATYLAAVCGGNPVPCTAMRHLDFRSECQRS